MESPTYYTGIDLHKRTAYLTTVDDTGSVAGQKKLPCRRKALREYFDSFEAESCHQAAVETTTGWYWVADLLGAEGVDLKLAHAKYLKAISYAKVKTDKVDSETLAQLLRSGMIPEAYQIDRGLRGHGAARRGDGLAGGHHRALRGGRAGVDRGAPAER